MDKCLKALPSPFPNVIPDYVDDDDDDDHVDDDDHDHVDDDDNVDDDYDHADDDHDNIDDADDNKSSWNAPFRWHWRQDDGQFEPYNDTINQTLEKCYEQWKTNGGPSTIITSLLTRYLDDTPQNYRIDYKNNRQTNMKTSYQRMIVRLPMDKPPENRNWFYRDEHGNWMPYESVIQNSIDKAFWSYRSGQGSSIIDIQFPNPSETYQINFILGQQINKTTSAIKSIKYEQGWPEPVKVGEVMKFFRKVSNKIFK